MLTIRMVVETTAFKERSKRMVEIERDLSVCICIASMAEQNERLERERELTETLMGVDLVVLSCF